MRNKKDASFLFLDFIILLFSVSRAIISPLIEGCTMYKSSTKSSKDDIITFLEFTFSIPQCQRNCSCTCITIMIDVDNNLVQRNTSTLGNRLNNTEVCLVRNYPVYIVCCQVVHLHDFHHIVVPVRLPSRRRSPRSWPARRTKTIKKEL